MSAASGLAGGGFGWGKPVQWQPHKIRRGISMSTAKILVAIAGPGMNLLLAIVIACVHVLLVSQGVLDRSSGMHAILQFAVVTNFILMFFNLLPLPPLDGGHVAESFTPYKHRRTFENIARYAPFAILAIIMIPQFRQIFALPAIWCTRQVYSVFGALFV